MKTTFMGQQMRETGTGKWTTWKKRLFWFTLKWGSLVAVAWFFIFGHPVVMEWLDNEMAYKSTGYVEAAVDEKAELRALPVEVLEERLVNIVWGGESNKKVMKEGEILQTFDPADSEYQACIKEGGKQPKYCISWGAYQIKMSMIQHYYPKVYDGKTITDMEAIQVANDNDKARRFFLDCSIKVQGCANEWSTFKRHQIEGQVYIDLIREVK